jgi:hypothetical protein
MDLDVRATLLRDGRVDADAARSLYATAMTVFDGAVARLRDDEAPLG